MIEGGGKARTPLSTQSGHTDGVVCFTEIPDLAAAFLLHWIPFGFNQSDGFQQDTLNESFVTVLTQ